MSNIFQNFKNRVRIAFKSDLMKANVPIAVIIVTGLVGFILAKRSIDRNRKEIMRSKRRIRKEEEKFAEEYYRNKRGKDSGDTTSSS